MRRFLAFTCLWIMVGLWSDTSVRGAPLEPPYELVAGQELILPAQQTVWPATLHIDLADSEYGNVVIEQRGLDVRVEDDGGSCLDHPWAIDMARGPRGSEVVPISKDADHPTTRLRLRPKADSLSASGDLVLRLSSLSSGPSAPASCRAWRAFLDARVESFDRQPDGQERAVAGYARSARLFRAADDAEGLGQALLNQAAGEHRLGRTSEALDHLSESRKVLSSLDSVTGRQNLVDAWNETAWILFRKGRIELAAKLFEEAARLAEQIGATRELAMALNGQGLAHKRLSRWAEALEAYRRAAELAEGEPCVESAARTNLGTAHTRLGEFQEGLAELSRAVELAAEGVKGGSPCRNLSAALNSQAGLYASLGRWDLAASASEEALRQASDANRLVFMVNHARALARTQRNDAARDLFLETIDAAREADDPNLEFAARHNLGSLLLTELDDFDGAHHQLTQAETLIDLAAPSRELAHLLVVRSKLHLSRGRYESAHADAIRAHEIGESNGHVQQAAEAALQVAKSLLTLGRPDEAAAVAAEANAAVERLRSRTASFDLRATYLADRGDYFETWIEALMARHRRDPAGEFSRMALEVAERARSRAFLDMLDSAAIERSDVLDPELAELERRRESLFLRRGAIGTDGSDTSREFLDHQLRSTETEILELKARIRAARPQWSSLREPEILGFEAMRSEVVDHETALLHSFVGDRTSWLWRVTSNEVAVFPLPGRDQLNDEVRRLLGLLRARTQVVDGEDLTNRRLRIQQADSEFETASRELAQSLLAGVLEGLDERRLVVVADGPLAYVPFGALADPSSPTWRPLVLDFQWAYLTSVSVLRSLRRTRSHVGDSWPAVAVIADPVFSAEDPRLSTGESSVLATRSGLERSFRRLPQSGLEAEAVAALAGPESLVAVGFDATASMVRSGRLRDFDIVHFATHGVIEAEIPELSALVLALRDPSGQPLDGFLRLAEIYKLELDADLVVLSACETALGQQIRGEGLVGLTRGFQYAGASSVLASLWTVQDRATRDLMERFYRHLLRDGMRPIAALHAVQRSLAGDPALAPYHWAGFVMQGDWR